MTSEISPFCEVAEQLACAQVLVKLLLEAPEHVKGTTINWRIGNGARTWLYGQVFRDKDTADEVTEDVIRGWADYLGVRVSEFQYPLMRERAWCLSARAKIEVVGGPPVTVEISGAVVHPSGQHPAKGIIGQHIATAILGEQGTAS